MYMSMPLDGFITGPHDGPGNGLGNGGHRLHGWPASEHQRAPARIARAGGKLQRAAVAAAFRN